MNFFDLLAAPCVLIPVGMLLAIAGRAILRERSDGDATMHWGLIFTGIVLYYGGMTLAVLLGLVLIAMRCGIVF
jgi:hypothetical protein